MNDATNATAGKLQKFCKEHGFKLYSKLTPSKPFDSEGCFNFDMPAEDNLIIVCYNIGGGWKPYQMLLPHQLYAKDVMDKLKEINGCTNAIAIFTVSGNDYQLVVSDSPSITPTKK